MSSIATLPRFASRASIGIVAKDRRTQLRILNTLTTLAGVDVRRDSVRDLIGRRTAHDLVVLHWNSVSSDELAVLAELKRETPDLLVIVVCQSADARSARRALDRGADGLVFADRLESALAATVSAALAGQVAFPRELRAAVRKPALSAREKQVLGMVVMGFTNAEISARLYLAESTVKSHLSSAFTKLGVRSRNEAAAAILDPDGSLGTGILAITPKNSPTA